MSEKEDGKLVWLAAKPPGRATLEAVCFSVFFAVPYMVVMAVTGRVAETIFWAAVLSLVVLLFSFLGYCMETRAREKLSYTLEDDVLAARGKELTRMPYDRISSVTLVANPFESERAVWVRLGRTTCILYPTEAEVFAEALTTRANVSVARRPYLDSQLLRHYRLLIISAMLMTAAQDKHFPLPWLSALAAATAIALLCVSFVWDRRKWVTCT